MSYVKLIADSGSTKTDWIVVRDGRRAARYITAGVNPFMMEEPEIAMLISSELLPLLSFEVNEICFYGAGCRGKGIQRVRAALERLWPMAERIEVEGDLLGAARALFPDSDGIACILGTGSNSGLYIDGAIRRNVPPMGYILGDEGSGASLGKRFLGDLSKGLLSRETTEDFRTAFPDLTTDEIIERVYRGAFPNRFLASFAPFLHARRQSEDIRKLLLDEFTRFFDRNIAVYGRPDLEIGFVGSIAQNFCEEILHAAKPFHYRIGTIKKAPLDEK